MNRSITAAAKLGLSALLGLAGAGFCSAESAFDGAGIPASGPLQLLRITPKGTDVPAARQLVFQFDRPVVALGNMQREAGEIPIDISPALACQWRWLNTSALACQLRSGDEMQLATRYRVSVNPGITTREGSGLAAPLRHTFITARPQVTYTRFSNWLSPVTPLLQVTFNQPVERASVERAMAFAAAGRATLPVRASAAGDAAANGSGEGAHRVWQVQPRGQLPAGSSVALTVRPGLVSAAGAEPGIENREVVRFDTFPAFRFVGLRCTLKGQRRATDILLAELQQAAAGAAAARRCAPLSSVALLFSAPVLNSSIKNHVTFEPRLDGGREDYDPWQNSHDWTRLQAPHRAGRHYQVWLPELLQAHRQYVVTMDRQGLADEFGRRLQADVAFSFLTSHREPALRLSHRQVVLEKGVDSDVPLYVTNLHKVRIDYDKLSAADSHSGLRRELPVPAAKDIAYALPLGARQLLDGDSGMLYGRLQPSPTPPGWHSPLRLLAQVTPYQIHAKIGHFNSLLWVSGFADGKPLAAAQVSLLSGSYEDLTRLQDLGITTTTDSDGLARLPGLAELDPQLEKIYGGQRAERPGFFARVDSGTDIAIIPINYHFTVRAGGIYPRLQKHRGHSHAWGTTAQGVYKLGDTVEFKIYVRDQSNRHWVAAAREAYDLRVFDPQQKVVFEQRAVALNAFGAVDGSFKIPEQGAVGRYRFELAPQQQPPDSWDRIAWQAMTVLVSDFTPAPFKVHTELNGELFQTGDQVQVTSLATLHAGGPFTDAELRVSARLTEKSFVTDNPLARGFTFGGSRDKAALTLLDARGRLDNRGRSQQAFAVPQTDIHYGSIEVESAIRDDRGKFIAASSSADYAGTDAFVGLKNTRWLYRQGKTARLQTLVVNNSGQLLEDKIVVIAIERREHKAARVKGPGNAYLTKNLSSWVKQSECRVATARKPVECRFTPEQAGYYRFVAQLDDSDAGTHQTTLHGWVTGSGAVMWDQSNDTNLQIVAEQSDYRIGDSARFLVKNPYPGARALVTVERYGILDSWIETLETGTPVIEVPVKADYLPGFYLSVVALSPRVDKPLGEGKVDLGKPAFRMGYVAATVSDPYKAIDIDIRTDRKSYKPRDRVKARLRLKPRAGKNREPYEIAVAVVDEAVLALNRSGRQYYDPYAGFNRLDPLDVNNYSLLARLLGRQKFANKGANPGGDGGPSYAQLRSQFKFVSYWNPSLEADARGRAEFEFEVPDNLTGWRILAFAVTPNDRMGLGDVNFKVNRPTEIRPLMPNQLLEGDSVEAGFSIMNRTDKTRSLKIDISAEGPLADGQPLSLSRRLQLQPFKRAEIRLPLQTAGSGQLRFVARGGDRFDRDSLTHSLPVNARRSLQTAASYGSTEAAAVSEALAIPAGIHTDAGSIGAVLSPSVIGNIDGAFDYLKHYPHGCWEQRLTRAVAASAYVELRQYLRHDLDWPQPIDDVRQTLEAAANFQAPNGGMAYWLAANQYVSPYLSAYTAMAFNWLRDRDFEIPQQVEQGLHDYLLQLLRRDRFPSFYTDGMSASVRAVALAALAPSGKISAADVQRHLRPMAQMDLFGKAHFLQAALQTPQVEAGTVQQTLDSILAQSSQSGGKFQFNEAWDDSYKYLLATPLRANCAVLSALLAAQSHGAAGGTVDDIPFKLVRSISHSRGARSHWQNTQENIFCLNALVDYAGKYEAADPAMTVAVSIGDTALGSATFSRRNDPPASLSRPLSAADPGRDTALNISRSGSGRLYYAARIAYAPKRDSAARINAGIDVRREYSVERDGSFELLRSPMQIRRGELVKVDLFISVPTARHFVSVYDPVPGGLEPVNTDLATASGVDAGKARFAPASGSWYYQISDWSYFGRYFWSFYHRELRHDSARFYADYLPAGNYHLSYAAQAIASGEFGVMPLHAEEMYDPDVYGKGLPATLSIGD